MQYQWLMPFLVAISWLPAVCAVAASTNPDTLVCWGNAARDYPPPAGHFVQLSNGGEYHFCAIRQDNTLTCWGGNNWGQTSTPSDKFNQVSAGYNHTCGVTIANTLKCWGNNSSGQTTPPTGTFNSVAAGGLHNCAIRTNGTLTCWGNNDFGQTTPPAGNFLAVSAGGTHSCAIKTDNSLVCWGDNQFGQAASPSGSFQQVSAGRYHTCGVQADGGVNCWGLNDVGQAAPPDYPFSQVSAGENYSCGLKIDGTLACWGSNEGNVTIDIPTLQMQSVSAGLAASGSYSCAILANLTVTAAVDSDGNITPTVQVLAPKASAQFTAVPNAGYVKNDTVSGTCPTGNWSGNTWFTGAITANCSVSFSFDPRVIALPTVTTTVATNIAAYSANINGTVMSGGDTATASFDFGRTTAYGTSVAATPRSVFSTTAVPISAIPTGLECGTTYHYRARATNSAGSAVGTDQSFTTLACPPDFVITGININPATLVADSTFTATVTIQNQGDSSGNGGWLDVWTNQSVSQDCEPQGTQATQPVGFLAAGASTTLTFTGLSAGSAGSKMLRAFVDSDCSTPEIHDDNNQRTLFYSVNQTTGVDLVVTAVTLNPTTPTANGTFAATVTVKNQGSVAGDGKFLDAWSHQPEEQVCGAVGDNHQAVVEVLAPGATKILPGATKILTVTGLTAGVANSNTFRAFIDSGCGTPEDNESNNQVAIPYAINQTTGIDFVVTKITVTPVTPTANNIFSAAITVKNQGTVSGNGKFLAVWSHQTDSQVCGAEGDQRQDIGVIEAGATKVINFTGLPSGNAGNKMLRAFIDSNCETAENEESNDQATAIYAVNQETGVDLIVTAVSFDPVAPTANGTFKAVITVKNQGAVASGDSSLNIWNHQPEVQVCGAVGDQRQTVSALGAGATRTLTFTDLSAAGAGNKMLRTFIDSACSVAENNEGNNQTTAIYPVNQDTGVDLVVTAITLTPAVPTVGNTFAATVTVTNQGTAAGDGKFLDVWSHQTDSQVCGAVGDQRQAIGNLAAGASKVVTVTDLPAGIAGSKMLRAFIDSGCETAEKDEGNNQLVGLYNVNAPMTGVDFVVTNITVTPAIPNAGGTFTATVTVKNQGTANGDGKNLEVWSHQTDSQVCDAVGDQRQAIGVIAAGASKNITVNDLPAGIAGSKMLRAVVDSNCGTGETDEGNNQGVSLYNVNAPSSGVDFTVTNITVTPSIPNAGGTFVATVTVKNQGTVAGDGKNLEVWSHQTDSQVCGTVGDQRQAIGVIAAGASKVITVNDLPAGIAGSKMLRAVVDSNCGTRETNEGNNQEVRLYNVNAPTAGVDFMVTNVILMPPTPSAGGTFAAIVTVKNQGTAAGDGKFLDVWSHQPNGQVCGAVGDQRQAIGVLAAGESRDLTLSGLSGGIAGSKMLRAFVDSGCGTAEKDKVNNQFTSLYSVNAPASNVDFVVTAVTLDPVTPAANGTFTATVTVKNQGTVAGDGKFLDVWSHQPNGQICGAVGDKRQAVGILAAGQSKPFVVVGLPATGIAGNKLLHAFVDNGCGTAEKDESNNQFTSWYSVNAPASNVNFVVTGVTLNPVAPNVNGTFTATVTVKNLGTAAGDGKFLDVWSHQTSNQVCGAVGDKRQAVGSVAAGASKTLTVTGLAAGAVAANKMFRAFVDSGCSTLEKDESNNQFTSAYNVSNVDFVVTGVTFNPVAPNVNGTFTATVTVKNQGPAAGDGKFLDVWSHQPNGQVCGAVGDKRQAVGSVAANTTKTLTFNGLAAGAVAGNKMLRAFVDSGCSTLEKDESNNQYTRLYAVNQVTGVDFTVTGITLTPAAPTANGTFTAAVTVKNQGTIAADGKFLDVWSHQSNGQVCGVAGDKRLAVGSLAAGAIKVLTVTGLPANGAGMKMLRAYVDSGCGTAENNEGNNQLTKTYTVQS